MIKPIFWLPVSNVLKRHAELTERLSRYKSFPTLASVPECNGILVGFLRNQCHIQRRNLFLSYWTTFVCLPNYAAESLSSVACIFIYFYVSGYDWLTWCNIVVLKVVKFVRDSDKSIFERLQREFEAAHASQTQGIYRMFWFSVLSDIYPLVFRPFWISYSFMIYVLKLLADLFFRTY